MSLKTSIDRKYTLIQPTKNWLRINWKELWHYRELIWILTLRDVKVQYAQTLIGISWALLKPILSILILSFVFGTVAQIGTGGTEVPHILFTTAGILGWSYFATVTNQAGSSIIGAQNMVKKVYFPRMILPLSKGLFGLIDLGIALFLVVVLMVIYQVSPSWPLLWLPVFIFIAILAGLTGGIWISALTIRYRDFLHITPLLLRIGMYATPIAFPSTAVPDKYQALFYLNPMAGVVEGIRWSLLGGPPPPDEIYISFLLIVVFLGFGLFYFNKVQKSIADIV